MFVKLNQTLINLGNVFRVTWHAAPDGAADVSVHPVGGGPGFPLTLTAAEASRLRAALDQSGLCDLAAGDAT